MSIFIYDYGFFRLLVPPSHSNDGYGALTPKPSSHRHPTPLEELFTQALVTLLTQPLSRFAIDQIPLALINGHHKNHDLLVDHLIDQPVPAAAQFDLVAVRQRVQTISFHARIHQNRGQLLLKLLAHGISQFMPLLQARASNSRL